MKYLWPGKEMKISYSHTNKCDPNMWPSVKLVGFQSRRINLSAGFLLWAYFFCIYAVREVECPGLIVKSMVDRGPFRQVLAESSCLFWFANTLFKPENLGIPHSCWNESHKNPDRLVCNGKQKFKTNYRLEGTNAWFWNLVRINVTKMQTDLFAITKQ